MIIDFHVHVQPPEDMAAFTGTGCHRNIQTPKQRSVPITIEKALEAQKIGGVDITIIAIRFTRCATWTARNNLSAANDKTDTMRGYRKNTIASMGWPLQCLGAENHSFESSSAP